jgi:hypothetical protein
LITGERLGLRIIGTTAHPELVEGLERLERLEPSAAVKHLERAALFGTIGTLRLCSGQTNGTKRSGGTPRRTRGKLFQDLWSPREDVGSVTQENKRSYIDEKYGVEEAAKIRRVGQVDAATVCQAEISRCG